jgi:uncharacterized protein (UPF0332 family)
MFVVIKFKIFCLLYKKLNIKKHQTVIFSIVLYWYETGLLLSRKNRYSLFEERMLKRISEHETITGQKNLHNEFHDLKHITQTGKSLEYLMARTSWKMYV